MNVDRVGQTQPDENQNEPAAAAAEPAPSAQVQRGSAPARPIPPSAAPPTAHAAHGVPPFSSGAPAGSITLNGTHWNSFAPGAQVGADVKAINSSVDLPVVAADFKISPKDVLHAPSPGSVAYSARNPTPKFQHLPATEQKWLNFAHDALMAGDNDGRQYFTAFGPDSEEISTQHLARGAAFNALLPNVLTANGVGKDDLAQLSGPALAQAKQKAADVTAKYREALGSMLHDPNVQVYKAAWDNTDDTDRTGLIAVNAATGEVRTLVVINPP